jgi:hypothetical protein
MADLQPIHTHQEADGEHWVPERTTPQGTLAHSVDSGHEDRDVLIGPVLRWLAGLGVVTAVCMVGVGVIFPILAAREKAMDQPPSVVFTADQTPPEPRLLPNPVQQAERPLEPLPMPIDYGRQVRKEEKRSLAEHGLFRDGLPAIDPEKARAVAAEIAAKGAPDAPAAALTMPSDGSGGLRTEDRLR